MDKEIGRLFLMPGQLFVGRQRTEVTTILGSCVAVCLWDKEQKIGGMNHYLLPMWEMLDLQSPKFGNIAIERLYEELIDVGAKKSFLVAKIFGGARILGYENNISVGQKNIEMAHSMLNKLNIPIVAHSVGGDLGRKIIFDTYTGVVQMKFIENTINKSRQTGSNQQPQ